MRNKALDIPANKGDRKTIYDKKTVEKQKFTALCTNCDERFNCTIRNNAAIIWHCEEYK